MYSHDSRQFSFSEFLLPFEGKLEAKNRWVQLAAMVPWQRFEKQYASLFSPDRGSPAKPFRMAFGALILKERLNCSDEELVEQIRENPYLQYFLGLEEFSNEAPFESSMMVHFRKRISLEMIGEVNEALVTGLRGPETPPSGDEPPASKVSSSAAKPAPEESTSTKNTDNKVQLILDATCTPADITYPTDSKLLNEAREKSEVLVDVLHTQCPKGSIKPRTYRKIARKKWLSFSKKRQHTQTQIRKISRSLLGCLGRNLKHLDKLIDQVGAKLSASLDGGYFFLDRLDWNNFNESKHLISQVETYRQRRGCYPTSVHVDKIYRTKENRDWCKEKGIRLSGPKLGRPLKNTPQNKEQILQNKALARQDEIDRIPIEGKFGQSKRRFGLDRVMTKLAITSQCVIAMTFLVINLEKGLRLLFLCLFYTHRLSMMVLKNLIRHCTRKNTTMFAT